MTERIEKTIQFLNQTFDFSPYWKTKPEARAYRYDHSIRVAKIGAQIAEAEGFDREALVIACLLHDCSYGLDFDIKNSWLYKEPAPELEGMDKLELIRFHGYISGLHVLPFVESLGYKGQQLEDIVYALAHHTLFPEGAKIQGKESVFTRSVFDADEIDHVSAFRFYEDLQKFDFTDSLLQMKK